MRLKRKIEENVSRVNNIIDYRFYFILILGILYSKQKTVMIIQKECINGLDYIHVFEFENRNNRAEVDKIYHLCLFIIGKESSVIFLSHENTDIETISPIIGVECRFIRESLLDLFYNVVSEALAFILENKKNTLLFYE